LAEFKGIIGFGSGGIGEELSLQINECLSDSSFPSSLIDEIPAELAGIPTHDDQFLGARVVQIAVNAAQPFHALEISSLAHSLLLNEIAIPASLGSAL